MTTDRSAAGRSANRRGKAKEREAAAWLRDTGLYPHAEVTPVHGTPGDLTGVGDRIVEVTIQPWDRLTAKLRQAEADAAGAVEYCVWRPVKRAEHEPGTIARSLVIFRAEVAWPMMARLDRLEQADADLGAAIEAAEQRGYRIGYQAGKDTR